MIDCDIEFNYGWTDFWLLPNITVDSFAWPFCEIHIGFWCWHLHFIFWTKKDMEND